MKDIAFRDEIKKHRKKGSSYGEIAKIFKIARSSVQRICNSIGRVKRKPGPQHKLKRRNKMSIKRYINEKEKQNERVSIRRIVKDLNLNVSRSTVHRTLKVLNFNYSNIPSKFTLTKKMKLERVSVIKSYVKCRIDWNKVVFTDEKRFSLVGCDSFYTWIHEGHSPQRISKVLRSPSLMVWGMILPNGLLSFRLMQGNQNSESYIKIIAESALPIIKLNMKQDFIFQQDNCPIHKSKITMKYFRNNNVNILPWAPYSPDLNIIENVWSTISNLVYQSGSAQNIKELEEKISFSVKEFNEKYSMYVKNLYDSMPTRICKVLENSGNRLKY